NNKVSFIPIGGIGDVTRNMYLYEYENEILIVDCGIGFADETMLGVDLLLPDISYLLSTQKKIVGMVLTHGHEDHIGALPFILPQFASKGIKFPIYGSPLTSALANEKIKEFNINQKITTVNYDNPEVKLGNFSVSFIRVTHSIPDSAHLFIKTPPMNFYHGSDFKFDLTPFDGKKTDFPKIVKESSQGVVCLMSDCLRSEKEGFTKSEQALADNIEREMRICQGKFILTTYSSSISRLNQAVQAASKLGRKVVFVGRSLINTTTLAQNLGYMKLDKGMEVSLNDVRRYRDKDLLFLVAGSQAQENSALSRIANGEHREISVGKNDMVLFSADPIPGNEVSINALVDNLSRKGVKVIYSQLSDDFHVSGHGAADDLMLLMELVKPKKLVPIGGTYRQMIAYKNLGLRQGFLESDIFLIENGWELVFENGKVTTGKKISTKNIYVDQISGGEIESIVLRDREKLSKEGVVIVIAEIDTETGQAIDLPTVVTRGLSVQENRIANKTVAADVKNVFSGKKSKVTDWIYIRKKVGEAAERSIFKNLKRRPLVLPVVIEE
ncbi:MAG: ribonuclease J, partial [Patescibacteria group bacterium]